MSDEAAPKQKRTYTPEQARNELWRRGMLRYKFKPIQKRLRQAFDQTTSFLFVSLVARQTGKSFHWAALAIETCIQKKNARVRYGTAFQSDLEEFIRPIFETILEDAPRDVRPKYKAQGAKYVFQNGSELKLVGLDLHPNGLRGNALDLVVIDEAGFVSKLRYIFSSILLPMLRNRPKLRIAMSSTPPESPDHDFTEFAHEALEEGKLFKATIDDDETVTQETKDTLAKEAGGYDSTTYRREFMCEFVTDSDLAIIPEWSPNFERAPEPNEFYPFYHRYAAMDLGVVDFTVCLFAYYDFKRAQLVIVNELSMRGPQMTTDVLAKALKEKEVDTWQRSWDRKLAYRRVADNNNPLLLQDLSAMHDIQFSPTSKDELEAMVNETRLLTKQGRIIVDPEKCPALTGCLRYGIYNSKKSKREFARSKVYGHYDALAALIYLVRNLDTNTNPIPAHYGANQYTHHIPRAEPSAVAKTLAQMVPARFTHKDNFNG